MKNDLISKGALLQDIEKCKKPSVDRGGTVKAEPALNLCLGLLSIMVNNAPVVEAVPVERLGKLGKLMLPYKGCPRGPMGRMGSSATMKDEAFVMDVITDVDGGKWIPVQESVLHELVEGFEALRPKGRWGKTGEHFLPYQCTNCGEKNDGRTKFCPECGAKMEDA